MKTLIVLLFAVITLTACRKPYTPPAITAPNSYLVVEGIINSGADSTIIKLSRTVKLSASTTLDPVLNALVTVEGDDNSSRVLTEGGNGKYIGAGLNLAADHKYRLKIVVAGNKEYASEFVPVVNSPAIDSVSYRVQSNGVSINVNTHSNTNTRYYRWEYDETWIHESDFASFFKSNGDTVLRRAQEDEIYVCWRNNHSSTITVGSSAKLAKDVISDLSLTFISRHSDKIRHKYSILVKQYALTENAYNFWQNLKKNTEDLGSIFDAQPSEISGNIHSLSDATEPVIGYVSVGTSTVKRVFIDQSVLPAWLDPLNDGCVLDTAYYKGYDKFGNGPVNQVDQFINFHRSTGLLEIPVAAISLPGGPILGYSASRVDCVDCTLTGTNVMPAFWQ